MNKFALIILSIVTLISFSLSSTKMIQYFSYDKHLKENEKIKYTKKKTEEAKIKVEEALKKEEEVKEGKDEEIEVFNTWKKMLSQIRKDTE